MNRAYTLAQVRFVLPYVLASCIVFASTASAQTGKEKKLSSLLVGLPMPSFELVDDRGRTLKSSDLSDGKIVLSFFHTFGSSGGRKMGDAAYLAQLAKSREKWEKEGARFVLVASPSRIDSDELRQMVSDAGLDDTLWLITDRTKRMEIWARFGHVLIGTTLVSDGVVEASRRGSDGNVGLMLDQELALLANADAAEARTLERAKDAKKRASAVKEIHDLQDALWQRRAENIELSIMASSTNEGSVDVVGVQYNPTTGEPVRYVFLKDGTVLGGAAAEEALFKYQTEYAWQAYVAGFIKLFNLEEPQIATAKSILKEITERAKTFKVTEKSRKPEDAMGDHPLYAELKSRLEALPTEAQWAAWRKRQGLDKDQDELLPAA